MDKVRDDERKTDNFEFGIAGTPCEEIGAGRHVVCPDKVLERFPSDGRLDGASGFLGVPLFDQSGKVIGVLAGVSGGTIASVEEAHGLLGMFATMAAIELQRRGAITRLEKSERLMKEAQHLARVGHWEWDVANDRTVWSDEQDIGRESTLVDHDVFLGSVHRQTWKR